MNDVQASLGLSQLNRINEMLKKRNKIATIYKKELESLPIKFQEVKKKFFSSYHLFIIRLIKNDRKTHKKLFIFLRNNKIFVNLHYLPVLFHPFYKKIGFKKGDFPNSEKYLKNAIRYLFTLI